jgi:hypothetical protein
MSKAVAGETAQPFLRPLSAVAILVMDWWLFGGSALSFGLGTIFELTVGAVLAGSIVAFLQSRAGDRKAPWKGLLAGAIVGFPMPVAGTTLAVMVLGLAGVRSMMDLIKGEEKLVR